MKALLLGGQGLLGQALTHAITKQGWILDSPKRAEFDIANPEAVAKYIENSAPDVIFNTIAYTKVDEAEENEAEARRVNHTLPLLLGRIVYQHRAMHLVQLSTDFVFNGKGSSPYVESDPVNPINIYGKTKAEGEKALLAMDLPNCTIVRTAWLFGPGRPNFVSTILQHAKQKPELLVVSDQLGSPTYTPDLAKACLNLATVRAKGLCHVVNAGQASWCELAAEAVRLANLPAKVHPIPSNEWPQKAARPTYSVLDTQLYTALTTHSMRPWMKALQDYIFTDFLPSK